MKNLSTFQISSERESTPTHLIIFKTGWYKILIIAFFFLLVENINAQAPTWSTQTTATGTSNTATVNKPASVTGGDFMVIGLMYQKGTDVTITPPTGWTLIRRTDQSNSIGMATYYKIATNAEGASYAFTLTNTPQWTIGASRITGVYLIDPINTSGGTSGTSSTTVTAPSITTTGPSNLVLAFFTNKASSTFTGVTTERYDVPNATAGGPSDMMASFSQAAAGATAAKNATATLAGDWVGQQVALNSFFDHTVTCGTFTVNYTLTPPNNCNASNGDVNITSVTGGNGTYTYLWTTVSGSSNVNGTTSPHLNTVKVGVFNVVITSNGVSCSLNIQLSISNQIGVPSTPDVTICNGTSVTLTATGCIQGYIWSLTPGGASVSNTDTYTTAVLNSSVTYYVVCTNGGGSCGSTEDPVNITVLSAIGPGSITAPSPATGCNPADPGTIASGSDGTGSGVITYRWESAVSPFTSWSSIAGASTSSYDPPAGLTATTQYRRITISTLNGVACESAATALVQFNINDVDGGTIAGDQGSCTGSDPNPFTSSAAATGSGTISYVWQSNITGCGGAFADITPSATGSTYDPPAVAQTTYYRRVAVSTLNGVQCTAASNCLTLGISDTQAPVISTCPSTRNIAGCTTGDITSPPYNASLTLSTYTDFSTSPNSGLATDNCTIATATYQDLITQASCPIIVSRRWTITDMAGNTATCDQTINVNDTAAPTGTPPAGSSGINACFIDASTPPIGTPAFDAVAAAASYTDNCLGAVTATLTGTAVTGNNCSWTVTYTFSVKDPCNNTLTGQTIQHTGGDLTAPAGSNPANITGINGCLPTQAEADGAFNAAYAASTFTDNCSASVTATLGSAVITGTSCSWTVTYNYNVADNCNNVLSGRSYTRSGGDLIAPTGTNPANITGINGCLPTQSEADAAFNSTYAASTFTDNCSAAVTATLGSAVVTGTSCGWTVTYNYNVADGCNNVLSASSYTRSGSDQAVPTGSNPTAMNLQCITGIPTPDPLLVIDEADNCSIPTVAFMGDSNNGGSGCVGNPYVVTRTYRISDACSNTKDVTQTITVMDNIAPTFTAPPDITLTKDDLCNYDASELLAGDVTNESDNCSTGLNATKSDVINDGPCDGALVITRTWSLSDNCGNLTTHNQIINVQDITPPVLGTLSSVDVECGTALLTPAVTIQQFLLLAGASESDNCSGLGSLTLSSITSELDGDDCQGVITRTYYVADGCGNSAATAELFNVSDNSAPVVTPGVLLGCYDSVAQALAAADAATTKSDNCTPAPFLGVDVDIAAAPGGCDSVLTVTVTDICGNFSTAQYETMINCQAVRLKVFLEGAYNMTTNKLDSTLNMLHTLPGQDAPPFYIDKPAGQPYQGVPWNYTGNLGNTYGDGMGMTPYPPDVVDWVLVMVRENGILPANTIWTCAGWVHTDGTVTFPDACPFPAINVNDAYYIVVQHRNHLGIMSPSFVDIDCDGAYISWNFTTSDSYKPIFRFGQKELESGTWAMYTGNGEQLSSILAISSPDRTVWKTWQGTFGYSPGDYILNASTNSSDETAWKNNQNKTSGVVFY